MVEQVQFGELASLCGILDCGEGWLRGLIPLWSRSSSFDSIDDGCEVQDGESISFVAG